MNTIANIWNNVNLMEKEEKKEIEFWNNADLGTIRIYENQKNESDKAKIWDKADLGTIRI